VRDGVTSEVDDVVLSPQAGGETCAFDGDGNAVARAGSEFPRCSPSNDLEDGSNSDCTGLRGAADPQNPCGQFFPIPVNHDCDRCAELGKGDKCVSFGFCITGDLEIPLEGPVGGYLAAGSGSVLFGWDDEGTDAIRDESTRPGDPMWLLPPPELEQETGPNGFRARAGYDIVDGGKPIAFECIMASGTPDLLRPTEDSSLVSFEIQTR
jgi:hypothetical protein